jgi:hypothetical protein
MVLITALNTAMRNYFDRAERNIVKCKSVTVSRFATHKWTQIHQTRKIAGTESSPTPVCRYNLVSK